MKNFFSKYKILILVMFSLLILSTLILILFSAGPQQGAFIYQIH